MRFTDEERRAFYAGAGANALLSNLGDALRHLADAADKGMLVVNTETSVTETIQNGYDEYQLNLRAVVLRLRAE